MRSKNASILTPVGLQYFLPLLQHFFIRTHHNIPKDTSNNTLSARNNQKLPRGALSFNLNLGNEDLSF
jgi:hypothetical protein